MSNMRSLWSNNIDDTQNVWLLFRNKPFLLCNRGTSTEYVVNTLPGNESHGIMNNSVAKKEKHDNYQDDRCNNNSPWHIAKLISR